MGPEPRRAAPILWPILVLAFGAGVICCSAATPLGDPPDASTTPDASAPVHGPLLVALRTDEPEDLFPRASELWTVDLEGGEQRLLATFDEHLSYAEIVGVSADLVAVTARVRTMNDGVVLASIRGDGWTLVEELSRRVWLDDDGSGVFVGLPGELLSLASDGTIRERIAVEGEPFALAPSRRWVLTFEGLWVDPVRVLDLADGTTRAELEAHSGSSTYCSWVETPEVWFDADERVMHAAPVAGGGAIRLDLESGSEPLPVDVPETFWAFAFDRCRNRLLGFVGGSIYIVDADGARELVPAPEGVEEPPSGAYPSPDGRYVVWSSRPTLAELGVAFVSDLEEGVTRNAPLTATTRSLVVGGFAAGFAAIGFPPSAPGVSPEELVPAAFRVSLRTGEVREVSHCGRTTPLISPDGNRLVVCEEAGDRVWVGLRAPGGGIDRLLDRVVEALVSDPSGGEEPCLRRVTYGFSLAGCE